MRDKLSTKVTTKPPQVEVPVIGLGTMRPSGTYIAVFLQLEPEGLRAKILTRAAKDLGISLAELVGAYEDPACAKCGVSVAGHKENGGNCF
jgi:hypothetical protein